MTKLRIHRTERQDERTFAFRFPKLVGFLWRWLVSPFGRILVIDVNRSLSEESNGYCWKRINDESNLGRLWRLHHVRFGERKWVTKDDRECCHGDRNVMMERGWMSSIDVHRPLIRFTCHHTFLLILADRDVSFLLMDCMKVCVGLNYQGGSFLDSIVVLVYSGVSFCFAVGGCLP